MLCLGTVVVNTESYCVQVRPWSVEKEDRLPTSRKLMQTCKHNLRGAKGSLAFMLVVTNPQVSS